MNENIPIWYTYLNTQKFRHENLRISPRLAHKFILPIDAIQARRGKINRPTTQVIWHVNFILFFSRLSFLSFLLPLYPTYLLFEEVISCCPYISRASQNQYVDLTSSRNLIRAWPVHYSLYPEFGTQNIIC